jgi:hypothetical protein
MHRAGAHGGTVEKNAYTMCVLTQFHRHLKRRDIYAEASARWRDPRAQLLAGDAWQAAKGAALTDLRLPEDPATLLAEHAMVLHMALRDVSCHVGGDTGLRVDDEGRLHVAKLVALPDPASLTDLQAGGGHAAAGGPARTAAGGDGPGERLRAGVHLGGRRHQQAK